MSENAPSTQIVLDYSGNENDSETLQATLELTKYVEATEFDTLTPATAHYPWTMTETTNASRSINAGGLTKVLYNHVVIQAKHRVQQEVFIELYDAYRDFELVRILDSETSRPKVFKEMKTYSVVKSEKFAFEKSADISDISFISQFLDITGKVMSGVRYILDTEENVIHFYDRSGRTVAVSVVIEAWLSRKIDYYSIDRKEFINASAQPTKPFLMKTDIIGFHVDYTDWDTESVVKKIDEYCSPFMIVLRDTQTRKVLDVLITNLTPLFTGSETDIKKVVDELGKNKIEKKPIAYAYSVYTGEGSIIYSQETAVPAATSK